MITPRRGIFTSHQYGIYSSEEIEKMSVCEINNPDFLKACVVEPNGVNDFRLGTQIVSMICGTCGLEYIKCPGHSGHIKLHIPIFNVMFSFHLEKILTCICFKCCRLLLPEDSPKYKYIMSLPTKKRISLIYDYCKSHRRCETHAEFEYRKKKKIKDEMLKFSNTDLAKDVIEDMKSCGSIQPFYNASSTFIRPVFEGKAPIITPQYIRSLLMGLSDETILILGCDPKFSKPSSMMMKNMLVPSPAIRPSKSRIIKIANEHDMTLSLNAVVKINEKIKGANIDTVNLSLSKTEENIKDVRLDLYEELQLSVAQILNSKYKSKTGNFCSEYGSKDRSVHDTFAGSKYGVIRQNLYGKRLDNSSRTVVSPDNTLEIDQVGVPIEHCKVLFYPEIVTRYNIHKMTQLIRNGPDVYPGANYVIDLQDNKISLHYTDRMTFKLRYGFVVNRHLIEGDYVLFNRQPSLHKFSIMAHRVVPHDGISFKLHLACTTAYNADFDGDEMNSWVTISECSRSESIYLMSVKKNLIKDMIPIIRFQQNSIVAAFWMTREDEKIKKSFAQHLWYQNQFFDYSRIPKETFWFEGEEYYTGRQVFQACLPEGLNVDFKSSDPVKSVVIRNGSYISGQLSKYSLNGNGGIIFVLTADFGHNFCSMFISGVTLFLEEYIIDRGYSINIEDCFTRIPDSIKQKVKKGIDHVNSFTNHDLTLSDKNTFLTERHICDMSDGVRNIVSDYIHGTIKKSKRRNGLYEMIYSGAKGNITNIEQIQGMLGQQRDSKCRRFQDTLTHSSPKDKFQANGMIINSFASGLTPTESFYHFRESRVGLVETAVKIADTGYAQRRLAKAVEDTVVRFDGTVRNNFNEIIQINYGDDGFDATYLENNYLCCLRMSDENIIDNFVYYEDNFYDQANEMICLKTEINKTMIDREFNDICLCPINFNRTIKSCESGGNLSSLFIQSKYNELISYLSKYVFMSARLRLLLLEKCSVMNILNHKLTIKGLEQYFTKIKHHLVMYLITPNECVGSIAGQHSGEPLLQMSLNSFHMEGDKSAHMDGVQRINALFNVSKNSKYKMTTVFPKVEEIDELATSLIELFVCDLISQAWRKSFEHKYHLKRCEKMLSLYGDEMENEVIFLVIPINKKKAIKHKVSPFDIAHCLRYSCLRKKLKKNQFDKNICFSKSEDDEWWVSFACFKNEKTWKESSSSINSDDEDLILQYIYEKFIFNCNIKGCKGISGFSIKNKKVTQIDENNAACDINKKVIITTGCNLADILCLDAVDPVNTTSNDVFETFQVLGIDAACEVLYNEIGLVMTNNKAHCGARHYLLIANYICFNGSLFGTTYSGICTSNTSVMKSASFEKPLKSFVDGAIRGHKDQGNTVSTIIAWNGILNAGTGSVKLVSESSNKNNIEDDLHWYSKRSIPYNPLPIKDIIDNITVDIKVLTKKRKRSSLIKKISPPQPKRQQLTFKFIPNDSLFIPQSPTSKIKFSFSKNTFIPESP
jgi:DNA-directed RNA polymerase II subunit RPB1